MWPRVRSPSLKLWCYVRSVTRRLFCPESKKPTSEAVAEYLEERKKYEERKKDKRKKGSGREEQVNDTNNNARRVWTLTCGGLWKEPPRNDVNVEFPQQTMELLNRFKSKLSTAISEAPEEEEEEEELAEDDDKGWWAHQWWRPWAVLKMEGAPFIALNKKIIINWTIPKWVQSC